MTISYGRELDENGKEVGSLLTSMVNGSWLDAQQFPELEWTVEGIIPEGFGLIVAPPKAGKSWLVAGIGLACAAGGRALGKVPVKQRPVLYLALEDGHRRLQSRFRTLMEGAPIPSDIHVITKAQPLEALGMIAEFFEQHRGAKPLVVVDTLGKVKPPKRSGDDSYQADYRFGSRYKELVDAAPGSSLLMVHHNRKVETGDFVDSVSGTQAIAGSADYVLVLARKRQSAEAILSVTGRDVEENEYALRTEAGRWSLDGIDVPAAARTVVVRREQSKLGGKTIEILDFIDGRTETRAADLAAIGIDTAQARVYLSRLAESGHIEKAGRGLYRKAVTSVTSVMNSSLHTHTTEEEHLWDPET